jgi:hypothetical protein
VLCGLDLDAVGALAARLGAEAERRGADELVCDGPLVLDEA